MYSRLILTYTFTLRAIQYRYTKFSYLLDSCPDRWGRLLMKRREAALASQENRKPKLLIESDYLLGVHDMNRMGLYVLKLN